MNDVLFPESWRLLSRARGEALVLRLLVLVSATAAVGCTWLAAGRTVPSLDVVIVILAAVCVVLPDSHVGLLVVLLVGVDWLVTVDNRTTPWAIGAAVCLAFFHASTAASSVAPPSARWSRAMYRRWLFRTVVVTVAGAATWGIVAVVHGLRIAHSAVWLTAALIVLAVAALWARDGKLAATRSPTAITRRARSDSNRSPMPGR